MFSPEINYRVCQEQHQDRLRRLELWQSLHGLENQPAATFKFHQKVIGWFGTQMVSWGSKLQTYSASSLSKNMAHEIQ